MFIDWSFSQNGPFHFLANNIPAGSQLFAYCVSCLPVSYNNLDSSCGKGELLKTKTNCDTCTSEARTRDPLAQSTCQLDW